MTNKKRKTSIFLALLPILIVIVSLVYFVIIKGGAPHIAIIIAIALSAAIGRWFMGYSWKEMLDGMIKADIAVIPVLGIYMAIGAVMGVPAHLTAAAVVSGAFFGDKLSPLSDTTNFCSGLVGVNLYKHIVAMLPSTIPAMVISFVLYWIMGRKYAGAQIATAASAEIITTLDATFKLNPFLLLPLVVVLVLSIRKFPPIPTLFAGI